MTTTRTMQTEAAYDLAAARLWWIMIRENGHHDAPEECYQLLTNWFSEQHGRWSRQTVNLYKAAIVHRIRRLYRAGLFEDVMPDANIDAFLDVATPEPRRDGTKETSQKKRKSVSEADVDKLITVFAARKDDASRLLVLLLRHLPRLGFRPCEVQTLKRQDHTVRIRCAKATNGRGIGKWREVELVDYDENALLEIDEMKRLLLKLRNNEPFGDWDRLARALAERLARACTKVGIARICLYTLRHVAIATMKRSGSRIDVAGFAGHGRTRTATESYGKARSGWNRPTGVVAAQAAIARVADNYVGRAARIELTKSHDGPSITP